eukprot:scaffold145884_cov37-Tisochrysis_lutea.AAC.3
MQAVTPSWNLCERQPIGTTRHKRYPLPSDHTPHAAGRAQAHAPSRAGSGCKGGVQVQGLPPNGVKERHSGQVLGYSRRPQKVEPHGVGACMVESPALRHSWR